MTLRILLSAIIAVFSANSFGTESGSAEEMDAACARMAEGIVKGSRNYVPFDYHSGYCVGAFQTVQANIYLFGARGLAVCVREPVSYLDLAAIFRAYNQKHPDRLSEPYFVVAIDALREVYPCPEAAGANKSLQGRRP